METDSLLPDLRSNRLHGLLWMASFVAAFFGIYALAHPVARALQLTVLPATAIGQLGMLLVTVTFALADGRGVRNLGLPGAWKSYDVAAIFGIIGIQMTGSIITAAILMAMGQSNMEGRSILGLLESFGSYSTGTFVLIALGLALQSGITEELLFRGYMITRLEKLGLGPWTCILLSALIFGLLHVPGYGLLPSMSKAIWFGIPTGAFFWYRRSLWQLMAAHALMNFLGFMAAHVAIRFLPEFPM